MLTIAAGRIEGPSFHQNMRQSHIVCNGGKSISVHSCPLRVAAELPFRGGTDGPTATSVTASGAALLQSQKLLGTEGLVVDLAGGFDQILKMGAGQEVAQVDEFAMVLVLDVDDTPAVLTTAHLLAIHDNGFLTPNNGERNDVLHITSELYQRKCIKVSLP